MHRHQHKNQEKTHNSINKDKGFKQNIKLNLKNKGYRPQINNLAFQLRKLEKEEQTKTQGSKRK